MPLGSVIVGVSGARRNPTAAVVVDGRLQGVCEQERLTRIRGTALRCTGLPTEAVSAVLNMANRTEASVTTYVTAEDGVSLPVGLPHVRLGHHECHAATAFLTSPFQRSAVLVCDRGSDPEFSVWLGAGSRVENQHWPWRGPSFASVYADCCKIFGFAAGQEHRLEALARFATDGGTSKLPPIFTYNDCSLRITPGWQQIVSNWLCDKGSTWPIEHGAEVARSLQLALGTALLDLIRDVADHLQSDHVCLAGGLFFNTFFNTLVATSGIFNDVFVPPNPGNAGVAAGAALAVGQNGTCARSSEIVSAFLGPEYELETIKGALDNCKLSYTCLTYSDVIQSCVRDLKAGRLVGWFQGRMEWGHRALGARSILASPQSPYVLDNLNVFLKQRERYRLYGMSVCEEDASRYFRGPTHSWFMEYEYEVKDRDRFRHVLPRDGSSLRVHTVGRSPALLRELLQAYASETGAGVLVNTSFNGFSEPIVCSPRDAIRVFYGTGIDVLIIDRFVIRK